MATPTDCPPAETETEPESEQEHSARALVDKLLQASEGLGGMSLYAAISPELGRRLAESFMAAAAKLLASGSRLVLPGYHHELQAAWPADCPFSEPELRAKVEALVETARDLDDRRREVRAQAREILQRLPKVAYAEALGQRPRSVYYALADAVSCMVDDQLDDSLDYLEERVAATPESLRGEWLRHLLESGLPALDEPAINQVVTALVGMLRIERSSRDGDEAPAAAARRRRT